MVVWVSKQLFGLGLELQVAVVDWMNGIKYEEMNME